MKCFVIVIFLVFTFTNQGISQVNSNFQLLQETDNNCGNIELNLDHHMKWYGIYKTDSGEYIQEIKITFSNSKNSDKNNFNPDSASMAGAYAFWTDKKEKSLFIIGSKKAIQPHKVSHHDNPTSCGSFIYPGQTKTIYTFNRLPGRKSFELNATGSVSNIDYCPEFENYVLRLSDKYDNWKSQNLSQDIEFMGECNMVNLSWFGDIDLDGLPDLLFSGSSNSRNQYNLFLSSEANEEQFVRLVARFELGNCY